MLRIVLKGFDKVLALRSSITVPIGHVRGATRAPDTLPHGLRLPGTWLPGLVKAGSFYNGTWRSIAVHDVKRAVNIELDHEHYAALIVEVEDPAATVAAINAAIGAPVASDAPVSSDGPISSDAHD